MSVKFIQNIFDLKSQDKFESLANQLRPFPIPYSIAREIDFWMFIEKSIKHEFDWGKYKIMKPYLNDEQLKGIQELIGTICVSPKSIRENSMETFKIANCINLSGLGSQEIIPCMNKMAGIDFENVIIRDLKNADSVFDEIIEFITLCNPKKINISRSGITSVHAEKLTNNLPDRCEVLSLHNNDIDDSFLESIDLKNNISLDLDSCKIIGHGFMENETRFNELDLSYNLLNCKVNKTIHCNKIHFAGYESIVSAFGFMSIHANIVRLYDCGDLRNLISSTKIKNIRNIEIIKNDHSAAEINDFVLHCLSNNTEVTLI